MSEQKRNGRSQAGVIRFAKGRKITLKEDKSVKLPAHTLLT